MEAPVPASALIHSATLVSAGIFILLKFHSLFFYTNMLPVIFAIGSITACYGGVVASAQSDMKKLLAYSTISHCGFLFASLALNNFVITVIYLYLHGVFKALTFFAAGSIIKYNGVQDMRGMGAITNQKLDCLFLIISSINLGGLPFTFGYMYKEMFLNFLIINYFNLLSYGFLIIGMLSSIVYVFKLIYYSCFDIRKGHLD
jgi:NADH-ubiquinone oxidoreductase chain 5